MLFYNCAHVSVHISLKARICAVQMRCIQCTFVVFERLIRHSFQKGTIFFVRIWPVIVHGCYIAKRIQWHNAHMLMRMYRRLLQEYVSKQNNLTKLRRKYETANISSRKAVYDISNYIFLAKNLYTLFPCWNGIGFYYQHYNLKL